MKKICSVCNGNGFIRVPYEQAREEVTARCDTCDCEGEREWFSFRLSLDKYTCDWDNIHYIRDLKDYLLL